MSGCGARHSEPIARRDPDVWDVSFWVEGHDDFGIDMPVSLKSAEVVVVLEKPEIGAARRAAMVIEDWANRQIRHMTFEGASAALPGIMRDLASTEV